MARILVIDDEPTVRDILRIVLELAGHDVLLAENGLLGIEMVRRQDPELIVLDLMMPVMDGGSVLGHLQEDEKTRAIPVLVLTAATVGVLRSRVERSGIARVMTKPFDPSEVVAAVNELIGASEARIAAPPA